MLRNLVLIFLLLLGCPLFAQDTELKLYRPEEAEIPLRIIKKISGDCWQQSERIKREDAWRCVAEGQSYDPCFAHSAHKEALCPMSPWTGDSVQIVLENSVDNSQHEALNMSEAYPWAIELATGEKCQAIEAGKEFDGMQAHYLCQNNTFLVGHVQRCDNKWRILQKKEKEMQTVIVAKAWF